MNKRRPPILIVSASDSSGAAGMQVDIRVADALGHPARCSLTGNTVQDSRGILLAEEASTAAIRSSIETALGETPGIGAIKVGALIGAAAAGAVADGLRFAKSVGISIVTDPVLRSTSGGGLLDGEGIDVLVEGILPVTELLTPNKDELSAIACALGYRGRDDALAAVTIMAAGAGGVIVTQGEGKGGSCRDVLYMPEGNIVDLEHGRIPGPVPGGTGCAFSTALAVYLSRELGVEEAFGSAVAFVHDLIEHSGIWGSRRLLFPRRRDAE